MVREMLPAEVAAIGASHQTVGIGHAVGEGFHICGLQKLLFCHTLHADLLQDVLRALRHAAHAGDKQLDGGQPDRAEQLREPL